MADLKIGKHLEFEILDLPVCMVMWHEYLNLIVSNQIYLAPIKLVGWILIHQILRIIKIIVKYIFAASETLAIWAEISI